METYQKTKRMSSTCPIISVQVIHLHKLALHVDECGAVEISNLYHWCPYSWLDNCWHAGHKAERPRSCQICSERWAQVAPAIRMVFLSGNAAVWILVILQCKDMNSTVMSLTSTFLISIPSFFQHGGIYVKRSAKFNENTMQKKLISQTQSGAPVS